MATVSRENLGAWLITVNPRLSFLTRQEWAALAPRTPRMPGLPW